MLGLSRSENDKLFAIMAVLSFRVKPARNTQDLKASLPMQIQLRKAYRDQNSRDE